MFTLRAALAAAVVCVGATAPAHAAETLTLDDAFARVIDTHPDLVAYRYTDAALAADAERAAQSPALTFGSSVENALGSGSASALGGAELTLSLASVIERGDKRGARMAVAEREREGLALLREGRRLDLLAEVARRYLDAVAADEAAAVARADLAQRELLAEAARRRSAAGSEPESVPLAAEATRLRVQSDLARIERSARHARQRLALLWGSASADFLVAASGLDTPPSVPDFDALVRQLESTPELQRFAHQARLREARLQLARSSRITDIEWQVGVRRLQAERDWGLVGSVAIPFGDADRAAPGIRAAEAELAVIEVEREGQQRALIGTLAEAWGQLDLAVGQIERIDQHLLPALQRAADAAERSYRAGAASYLDWAQLQSELIAQRRERLDTAVSAHRALIELQRLTGWTFSAAATQDQGTTP